jgi:hypothetical protein
VTAPLGGEKVSTWGMRFGKFGVAGLAIIGFVFVLYLLGSTGHSIQLGVKKYLQGGFF